MTRLRYVLWVLSVSLLLIQACAPRVQSPLEAARQAMPSLGAEILTVRDGAELGLMRWLPDGEAPRAVILALHGMNDYANAFALPAPSWTEAGIVTYAIDLRGFGRSPEPGIWPGTELLISDVSDALAAIRVRHPGVPVYVLGESMGGAVALTAIAEGAIAPDGLILIAPAVWGWQNMNFFYRAALWLTAHITPGASFTGEGLGRVPTDNIEVLRAMSRDPLVIKETRTDAIYGLVDLMDDAFDAIPEVRLPILYVYGGNDQIVPLKDLRQAAAMLCTPGVTAYYPGAYHMLLRDLEADLVWQDIAAWIFAPGRGLPSGFGRMREPSGACVRASLQD